MSTDHNSQTPDNNDSGKPEKCVDENSQKQPQIPPEAHQTGQDNNEDDSKKNPNSAWGAHLNKQKIISKKSCNSSVSSSPGLNYSKLTEKLMKGAKINIRSSLSSRKKSLSQIKNSNSSDINENSCSEPVDNLSNNESADISLNSVFDSPKPVQPLSPFVNNDTENHGFIGSYKPKIANSSKPKQSYTFRGIPSLSDSNVTPVTHRNVDLQWLDECLAEDKPTTTTKNEDKDTDIIYSSDEEAVSYKNEEKMETNSPPVIPVKRKIEENEEMKQEPCKKPRMELSVPDSPEHREENSVSPENVEASSSKSTGPKKNLANAAKQERLEQ